MKKNYRRKKLLILYPLQMMLIIYASLFFILGAGTAKLIEELNLVGPFYLFGFTFPAALLLLIPFGAAVFAIFWGFRLTNRIAGPIFNLHRQMNRASEYSDYNEVQFRKNDYFRDLEQAYNELLKKIRNKDGFSLIELMVAVAIAGVLMTIAVPNYMRFADKVRIQAGKGLLVGIFAAEKNFWAEHGMYSSRLDAIGFGANGKTYFNVGFGVDYQLPRFVTSNAACTELCNSSCPLSQEVSCQLDALNGLDGNVAGYANANEFQATGHAHFGKVYSGAGQIPYSISIDQDKRLMDIIPAW